MAEKRKPWMKFNLADFCNDPALKMCSRAARSLWLDLMRLMHEAQPYGFLLVKGKAPTPRQLSELVGTPPEELCALRQELEDHGVFSRVGDRGLERDLPPLIPRTVAVGIIFSRRMLRENAREIRNIKNGKNGGNPNLLDEGVIRADNAKSSEYRDKNQEPDKSPPTRGSRLSADWHPSDALQAWTKEKRPDLNFQETVESFKDYWLGAAGQKARKLDWDATWRNWVRGQRQSFQASRAAPAAKARAVPAVSASEARAENEQLVDRLLNGGPKVVNFPRGRQAG